VLYPLSYEGVEGGRDLLQVASLSSRDQFSRMHAASASHRDRAGNQPVDPPLLHSRWRSATPSLERGEARRGRTA
jgi:hypothetical protein